MKKVWFIAMMLAAGVVFAGKGKSDWYAEMGLTETQKEQVKSIKKAKYKKLKAYKKELQAETDAELAKVLSDEQMEKMLSMREHRQEHKAMKKHKKKKRRAE